MPETDYYGTGSDSETDYYSETGSDSETDYYIPQSYLDSLYETVSNYETVKKKKQIMIHEDVQILFATKWKNSNPVTRCHHDNLLFSDIIKHDLIYYVVECLIECEISNFMSSIGFISHNDIRITNRCDSVRILNIMYLLCTHIFYHSELEIFEFTKSSVSHVENFDLFHIDWVTIDSFFCFECINLYLLYGKDYEGWYIRYGDKSYNLKYNNEIIKTRTYNKLLGKSNLMKVLVSPYMQSYCRNETEPELIVNLSEWDMSNVYKMRHMFDEPKIFEPILWYCKVKKIFC
jgi:hypothetical protein